jgi:hypothetical protein
MGSRILRLFLIAALSLACAGVADATAAAGLDVRLVEAHNEGTGASEGLQDVQAMLGQNLPYARFDLLHRVAVVVPTPQAVDLTRGFTLSCEGAADALRVVLYQGGKRIVNTTLRLQDRKPVVLGGFRSPRGKYMIVLSLR